jgi:hypothetical protein
VNVMLAVILLNLVVGLAAQRCGGRVRLAVASLSVVLTAIYFLHPGYM